MKSNIFYNCKHHWLHPLSWSENLSLRVGSDELQAYPALAQQCLALDPETSYDGYVTASSPCLGKGMAKVLPGYLEQDAVHDIGRGLAPSERTGLRLSIAGSDHIIDEGQAIQLKAELVNHSKTAHVFETETDVIVSFYFRYRRGHADKQEVYRVRVPLGINEIKAGDQIVLSDAEAWKNPLNGSLGDAFHVRKDTKDWASGCRLSADIQFVEAKKASNIALQEIRPLLWSEEVLKLAYIKR